MHMGGEKSGQVHAIEAPISYNPWKKKIPEQTQKLHILGAFVLVNSSVWMYGNCILSIVVR